MMRPDIYVHELEQCLKSVEELLESYRIYEKESVAWVAWDAWTKDYDSIKLRCDILEGVILNSEERKQELEHELERDRAEKNEIHSRLDRIIAIRDEYESYVAELGKRQEEADAALRGLEYSWFSTLFQMRSSIQSYVAWLRQRVDELALDREKLVAGVELAVQREAVIAELDAQNALYSAYPSWVAWNELDNEERGLMLTIRELETLVGGGANGMRGEFDPSVSHSMALLSSLRDDINSIVYISDAFNGYRAWIYSQCVGPLIQRKVNDILGTICGDERPLFLECDWLDAIDTLSWFIRDGTSRIIIQKASGFQRFIVGIAMRVAINRIGLGRVCFTELFIDEGFTACDTDNLERVPEFLRGLLRFYRSIYLATHLDDLKGCADKQVFIRRDDGSGLSLIQYGDVDLIKEVEERANGGATGAKKKGRPTKGSVIVTKV
jgi:hypothetical protein